MFRERSPIYGLPVIRALACIDNGFGAQPRSAQEPKDWPAMIRANHSWVSCGGLAAVHFRSRIQTMRMLNEAAAHPIELQKRTGKGPSRQVWDPKWISEPCYWEVLKSPTSLLFHA